MKHPTVPGNKWIRPIRRGYKFVCCDCGLVHRLDFDTHRTPSGRAVIIFRARRDDRATAAVRAWNRRNGVK